MTNLTGEDCFLLGKSITWEISKTGQCRAMACGRKMERSTWEDGKETVLMGMAYILLPRVIIRVDIYLCRRI